jgi:FAD/FMN-containing dehydrogenase
VVLASGEIVNANAESNPDLWRGLKGSSNNLGVVTSFRMRAFPLGKFYGGILGLDPSSSEQQFQAFAEFADSPNYDPDAALITSLAWTSSAPDNRNTIHNLEYTGAVNTTADGVPEPPSVFQGFTNLPQLFSTERISNPTDFAIEMSAGLPSGTHCNMFVTHTYKVSATLLSAFYETLQDIVQPLRATPGAIMQVPHLPTPNFPCPLLSPC